MVRPEKAAYTDAKDGKKKTTTIYALNIELSAQDMQRLVGEMTQYARLFEQTKKLLGNGCQVEYVVEDEPEVERAPDVAQEFYPAEEIAPAQPIVTQPTRASEVATAAEPVQEQIWPKGENGNGNGHTQVVQSITHEQRKAFADLAIEHGYSPKQIKEILMEFWKVKNSSEIPVSYYEEVMQYFASDGQRKPGYKPTNDDIPF